MKYNLKKSQKSNNQHDTHDKMIFWYIKYQ
jgi:hypothetical protein